MSFTDRLQPDFSILPLTGRSRKWRGEWVWSGNTAAHNTFWQFRQSFAVGEKPGRSVLFVTAETRCRVWLNGVEIGRAPKPGQPWLQYYHRFDVSPHIQSGENVLAILVYYQGLKRPSTQPGLLVELEDGDGNLITKSDGSWRGQKTGAWREDTASFGMNFFYPFQEHFDSRKFAEDWIDADFDDGDWATVQPIMNSRTNTARVPTTGFWSRLIENPQPPMTDDPVRAVAVSADECIHLQRQRTHDLSISLSQAGQPVQVCRVEGIENLVSGEGSATLNNTVPARDAVVEGIFDPCLLVDFGRVITAYPELEIEGPAGAVIEIGYAERLCNGHFNNALECTFGDQLNLRGGRQVYQPFHWKAFRFLRLRVKYQKGEPVTIHNLRARVSTYPFEERGDFASADAELRGIWEICQYTTRLCSNEFLMDTPFREAAQWLGDVAAVTLGGIYACFGDTHLAREFYRQTAANQFPTGMISNVSNMPSEWVYGAIPDYSLEWLIFLWEHYLYTGDTQFLEEIYPQTQRLIHAFLPYLNENGFLEDVPYWVLIDWADTDRRGECAAFNALFFGALEALGKIASTLRDVRMAEHCRHLRSVISANFQAAFFCEDRGCFADARVDGELSEKNSEHASIAAIRFGLANDAAVASVLKRFYEDPREPGILPYTAEAEPFFTVFVLQALHRVGRRDLALQVIRDRWGRRMLDRGATSVYEEWSDSGSWRTGEFTGFQRTHSHAWSAAPAEFLIRNLMGLEILEPGARRLRINPHRAEFPYKITHPFPQGDLTVEWDGESLTVTPSAGLKEAGVIVEQ